MSAAIPISVLIPVRNEERNIGACLESVRWSDDVWVVDSQSTDRTVVLAEEAGAKVVQFHYDGGWPKKKNWALRTLPFRYDWILILDADERVDPPLRDELVEAIRRTEFDGFHLRWKFIFLGQWMRHSWSHGWMLRLIRRGKGEYEDLGMRGEGGWDNEVHENLVVEGRTGFLKAWLRHETRQDLSFWIRKQNEFSDWNAVRRLHQLSEPVPPPAPRLFADPLYRRRFLKAIYVRLPAKPLLMFIYLYGAKWGFLDGKAGLYFCLLRAVHELNISAKMYEIQRRNWKGELTGSRPTVLIIARHYLPGFRAGGPARSIEGIAEKLSRQFRFIVATLDRDARQSCPYEGIASNRWVARSYADVLYLSPRPRLGRTLRRLVQVTSHHLLYLNSLFDPVFTLPLLWGRRWGWIPPRPVLLAPRGELHQGALQQKRLKKRLFLWFARRLGLYQGLYWHATCPEERTNILRVFGDEPGIEKRVFVCRNLTPSPSCSLPPRSPKQAGRLRAVFLSRITPKKNLEAAIAWLSRLEQNVSLDVFGPISDEDYWNRCQGEAQKRGLDFHYQGAIPHEQVVETLASFDLLVLPTRGENHGHVVLEALLAGCPVAISDQTPWERLEEEKAGWVIPLEAEPRWLEVFRQVQRMEEPTHAKWREGARRAAERFLSDTQPADDHLRMFDQIMNEAERRASTDSPPGGGLTDAR